MNVTELAAAIAGAASVFLAARQHVWSWPVGLVNVLLYTVVFYRSKLYADMGLQVVYAVLSVYGWYHWLHGGRDRGVLPVSRTPARVALAAPLVIAAGAALLGTLLARRTDASLPYLDSALTAASLVAQWMMTRKWLECWLLWIAVDLVYVPMFAYKDLYVTAVLYAVFLALAVLGYREWRRALAARPELAA